MTNADLDWTKPNIVDFTSRYPDIMNPSPRGKMITVSIIALMVVLIIFGVWWLGLSFDRAISGIRQLGLFVYLMTPPSADGNWLLYFEPRGLENPPCWIGGWDGDGVLARLPNREIAAAVIAKRVPNR